MSSSDYLADSDSDYKEDQSDYVTNSILGPRDMERDIENSTSDPKDIENSVLESINHITPGIDTVPTKDTLITAQRIDETNEHLSKISKKLDIIIDLLRKLENNGR